MKRWVSVLVLVVLFAGLTAGVAMVSVQRVSAFAEEKNAQKAELVRRRVRDTIDLLESLSQDEYITNKDVAFEDKAAYLTKKNQDEQLGYMMVRILDGDINIYREGIGLASSLASRDYMQSLYKTGERQVTDAFLAGADGVTINYTVAVGIVEDGKVIAALMAAIYGAQIDEYLADEASVNVLVGSQLQYMGGISREQFGMAVAQALGEERLLTRPVENILLDFHERRSGSFWGLDTSGIHYFTYTPLAPCTWVVMTEVSALPHIGQLLIGYAVGVAVLIALGVLVCRKKKPSSEA